MTAQHCKFTVAHRTVDLGNVHTDGVDDVAEGAKRAVLEHGRIALFIGANGNAGACSWRHVDLDRHCRVHAESLVGTYELTKFGSLPPSALCSIRNDIRVHLKGLARKARAA